MYSHAFACHSYVLVFHPYVTHMYWYAIRMPLVCTHMSSLCHWYVLVYHPYVTSIYLYVTGCHLYILICYPYVTGMYLYVIHMSLLCTGMWPVCHSYVLVYPRMSLVCGFTMNPFSGCLCSYNLYHLPSITKVLLLIILKLELTIVR